MGSGDLWHFETPRSTTLSYSHPRRCARRARELSSFCTTLTTSGKLFDTPSTKKIPGCPHSIQHISLVVKVSKLIHFQTVGEILQSSGTCPNLTSNTVSKDQTTKRELLVLSLCLVCHTNKPLCHTWRIRSTLAAHVLTSWTFARVVLNSLQNSHTRYSIEAIRSSSASSLVYPDGFFTILLFALNVLVRDKLTILVRYCHIAHVHGLF